MRNLIFGLARPMLRLLGRDEEGAIGVLVAIFIAGGVLLGMGALVIDVGLALPEPRRAAERSRRGGPRGRQELRVGLL